MAPPATIQPHPYRWPALVVAGGADGRPCTECGFSDYHPIHDVTTQTVQRRVQLGRMSARFDLRADVPTDAEVLDEVWVRNDYRVTQRFSGTVVEIGGNIGAFAVLAAKAGAERVYSFEPEPGNRSRLEHHIKLNRVDGCVRVMPLAVTDGASATVRMVGSGGGARAEPAGEEGDVRSTTLAEIIAMYGPIEFLKLDAEGAEGPIIGACPIELFGQVRRAAIEWHGPEGPPGHPGASHLQHLAGTEFGPLVTKLADCGRLEIFGHPRRGGLMWWERF